MLVSPLPPLPSRPPARLPHQLNLIHRRSQSVTHIMQNLSLETPKMAYSPNRSRPCSPALAPIPPHPARSPPPLPPPPNCPALAPPQLMEGGLPGGSPPTPARRQGFGSGPALLPQCCLDKVRGTRLTAHIAQRVIKAEGSPPQPYPVPICVFFIPRKETCQNTNRIFSSRVWPGVEVDLGESVGSKPQTRFGVQRRGRQTESSRLRGPPE
ncbi:uncharacterized protein VTP21DRAFT_1217 [Calcarisporiella thermophila]|uniref:uncharacterized protein n=1 Tax=Calcarisporiella thermophila TaxID=911321 RepID=UPI0037424F4B